MFGNIFSGAIHRTRIHHANSIKLITLNAVHFLPQAVYFLSGKIKPTFIKHAIIWSVFVSSLNKGPQRRERSSSTKPNCSCCQGRNIFSESQRILHHLIRPTNKLSALIGSLRASLWNYFFMDVYLLWNKRKVDECLYYWEIKLSHLWSGAL